MICNDFFETAAVLHTSLLRKGGSDHIAEHDGRVAEGPGLGGLSRRENSRSSHNLLPSLLSVIVGNAIVTFETA